jgi:hypothetical protein
MNAPRLTRWFLRVFIVSICATAFVGVFALTWPGEIGNLEIKILLTTLVIAAASICGLACGGCLTRGHTILPIAGLALTGISACLLIFGLWVEVDSEIFWRLSASLSFFAVACAHLSMLFLANLAGAYRWAYLLAYQLILGLAALLAAAMFYEELFDNESYIRFTGVVSILVAAITLLIPVFHYMSREQFAAAQAEADPLFAVEEEIARVKKRLIELENKRRVLLGRVELGPARAEDGPDRRSPQSG